MDEPFLRLEEVEKSYGSTPVLRRVSLRVEEGETMALLGPSGSGKTTLLRLLAGFEEADSGRLLVEGREITRLPPARRGIGMVFQHYALFSHLSVGDNVAFGLETAGLAPAERRERVASILALVGLAGFQERRVDQISGGQQQRVALARALAPSPRLLLLDEPLSNLDPGLRERTRRELAAALRRVGITTLLVTHEQEEAFHLGDRVALLNEGRLEQVGTPEELYGRPGSPFVATFVGRASLLWGRMAGPGRAVLAAAGPGEDLEIPVRCELERGAELEIVLRPEDLSLAAPEEPGSLAAEVVERRFGGARTLYTLELTSGQRLEVEAGADAARPGDRVGVIRRRGAGPAEAFPASRADGGRQGSVP